MFQKRLKKELNKIEVPAYDTHKYKETIAKAKKIKLHPENLRMSSTEFFCNQLRFIKTETWILKIIVSAFFVFYFCLRNQQFFLFLSGKNMGTACESRTVAQL